MMAESIKGIQSVGVMACAKHYIANEQEHFRQAPEAAGFGSKIDDSLSSNIDDATMHETYLWYEYARIHNHEYANPKLGHLQMLSELVSGQLCALTSRSTIVMRARIVSCSIIY